MSEKYTPDEAELIGCYAGLMEEQAGENYDQAKADAERGIEAIKAKARAEAFNDARHTMQLSLDAAIKPIRAEAWDEGVKSVRDWWETPDDEKYVIFNPYGTHPADRLLDDINANGESDE